MLKSKKRSIGKWLIAMFLSALLLVVALPLSASARVCYIDPDSYWAVGFNACKNEGLSTFGWENNYTRSWWYQYGGHNCTNYVAYRLSQVGVSSFLGGGNADTWANYASNAGYSVNDTATPGSIAFWNGNAGHVAIVEEVNPTYLVISQDSWGGDFSWAFIDVNHAVTTWPDKFIHIPALENQYHSSTPTPTPADKITLDNPWLDYRSENNAIVHSVIRNNGAAVGCDKYNFKIWEKYSGKLLKTYSEDISHLKQYDHNDIWLDIATETGLYLSPNMAYQCQFSAEKGGKTYSSSKFEFITKYSSSENSKKPANVKLIASTTECKAGDTVTLNFSVTDGISAKGARYFQLLQNGSVLKDKLTVTSTSVTLSKEGEYTFTLRAVNDVGTTESAAVKVVVTENDGEQEPVPGIYPGTPFTDISSHWGRENIKWAYENKLFSGVSATRFAPEQNMNRGMLATVLWRLAGQPGSNGGSNFFDVPQNAYYAKAVAWAAQNGVVSGVGKGKYDPDGNITREQLVTMLYRYAKPSYSLNEAILSPFTDGGRVSKFAEEAMCWAIENRILSGKGNGRLDPQGSATRAEVAAILNRYVGWT